MKRAILLSLVGLLAFSVVFASSRYSRADSPGQGDPKKSDEGGLLGLLSKEIPNCHTDPDACQEFIGTAVPGIKYCGEAIYLLLCITRCGEYEMLVDVYASGKKEKEIDKYRKAILRTESYCSIYNNNIESDKLKMFVLCFGRDGNEVQPNDSWSVAQAKILLRLEDTRSCLVGALKGTGK